MITILIGLCAIKYLISGENIPIEYSPPVNMTPDQWHSFMIFITWFGLFAFFGLATELNCIKNKKWLENMFFILTLTELLIPPLVLPSIIVYCNFYHIKFL